MCDPMTRASIHMVHGDLTDQLVLSNRLIDSIERGLDINTRITSMYKPGDPVAPEVLDYIQEYEDACKCFGWEKLQIDASAESAWDVIKNIVRSLWNMLCKLWESIRNAFRWVFNAQYRASKDAIKISQELALLNADKEKSEQFERLAVDAVLKPEDLEKFMTATFKLLTVMEETSKLEDLDGIDGFISSRVADSGLVWKDQKFVDTYEDLPYIQGTYGSCGWTAKKAFEASKKYIDLTRKGVNLKKIEKDLDSEISNLKRKQSNMVADGADITEVQKILTLKVKKYRVIHAAQEALLTRIDKLEQEFECFVEDAEAVMHGEVENPNDDAE